jgi:FixJ family two-component response regulator
MSSSFSDRLLAAHRRATQGLTPKLMESIEMMKTANHSMNGRPHKTVYVIEDDHATRSAMCELLEPTGLKVRSYDSAEAFLAGMQPNGPSCLLVDEQLPGMRGSELLRQLSRDGIRTPSVLVTAHATTPLTVEAMRHGATTVLDKPCSDSSLQEAVQAALEADAQRLALEEPQKIARERLAELSSSEAEVLRMVLDGVPNKQIANRLGVCVRTVESRRSKVYQTARVNSVAELVRLCVAAGVVDK